MIDETTRTSTDEHFTAMSDARLAEIRGLLTEFRGPTAAAIDDLVREVDRLRSSPVSAADGALPDLPAMTTLANLIRRSAYHTLRTRGDLDMERLAGLIAVAVTMNAKFPDAMREVLAEVDGPADGALREAADFTLQYWRIWQADNGNEDAMFHLKVGMVRLASALSRIPPSVAASGGER